MTKQEFQRKHLPDFTRFMASDLGRDFMETLRCLRPFPNVQEQEHKTVYSHGLMAGHEICQSQAKNLLIVEKIKSEVEQTYGVTEKDQTAKDAKAS